MLSWSEFAPDDPAMAPAGAALFHQFGGVGPAFLATTQPDPGPRLHPMWRVLHGEGLYALLIGWPTPPSSETGVTVPADRARTVAEPPRTASPSTLPVMGNGREAFPVRGSISQRKEVRFEPAHG